MSTSLIVCQPGDDFYSGFGHCALRLECPSQGLDATFTYALDDNLANRIAMFRGSGRGQYAAVKTAAFLREYAEAGRGVMSYRLGLGVEQTRALWQMLDEENAGGAVRKYNFLHTNCSSMCFYALKRVMEGEEIVWDGIDAAALGTYREFVRRISRGRPWTGFFWNSILGKRGEDVGPIEDKLAPMLVEPALEQARIVSHGDGAAEGIVSRPLLAGQGRQLVEHSLTYGRCVATPIMVFLLLLLVATAVSLWEWRRGRGSVVKALNVALFVGQTIVGCAIFYLSCISDMPGAAGNWQLLVWNPLPVVLWLLFRKRRWYGRVYLIYAAVLLVYIVSWAFMPCMELSHVLLALTLMTRVVMNIRNLPNSQTS